MGTNVDPDHVNRRVPKSGGSARFLAKRVLQAKSRVEPPFSSVPASLRRRPQASNSAFLTAGQNRRMGYGEDCYRSRSHHLCQLKVKRWGDVPGREGREAEPQPPTKLRGVFPNCTTVRMSVNMLHDCALQSIDKDMSHVQRKATQKTHFPNIQKVSHVKLWV